MLNKTKIKVFFGLWIVSYIIVFILIVGFNGKRTIGVEQHRLAGVIYIKANKLPVHGTTVFAEVPVQAKNVVEYLLLTNKEHGNFLSELLKLGMWVYAFILLWKIKLDNPFNYECFICAKRTGTLFILAYMADLAGGLYTNDWFKNLYHPDASEFQYTKTELGLNNIIIPLIAVSLIITFYRIATYNQREQELTI